MDKEKKSALVEEIASDLSKAGAIFAVDYRGISVPQAAELRGRLAEADATFRVVKNRLAKRAAEQAGAAELDELFEGPTALTLIDGDPVIAAKAIASFSREHDVLAYKGGVMDGASLDAEGFRTIARLPGLDVLHGQLVGLTASPLTGLVRGLSSMISGLAIALGQIQEKGLVEGEAEAPAAEDAAPAEEAEEAPAAEAEEAPAAEAAAAETEAPAAGEQVEEAVEEPAAEEDTVAEAEAPPAEDPGE